MCLFLNRNSEQCKPEVFSICLRKAHPCSIDPKCSTCSVSNLTHFLSHIRGDRLWEDHSDPPVPVWGRHRTTGHHRHHSAPASGSDLPGRKGGRGEEDSAWQAGTHNGQAPPPAWWVCSGLKGPCMFTRIQAVRLRSLLSFRTSLCVSWRTNKPDGCFSFLRKYLRKLPATLDSVLRLNIDWTRKCLTSMQKKINI